MAGRDHRPGVRIEVETRVRRPMAEVYAWCTDYRETDPELSPIAARVRRVVSRTPDRVELEDRGTLGMSGRVHYVVRLFPPDRWEADAIAAMGRGHNDYRLSEDGGVTRVHITFDLRPSGLYRILGPIARPLVRRRLSQLWDDFARDMETEVQSG